MSTITCIAELGTPYSDPHAALSLIPPGCIRAVEVVTGNSAKYQIGQARGFYVDYVDWPHEMYTAVAVSEPEPEPEPEPEIPPLYVDEWHGEGEPVELPPVKSPMPLAAPPPKPNLKPAKRLALLCRLVIDAASLAKFQLLIQDATVQIYVGDWPVKWSIAA